MLGDNFIFEVTFTKKLEDPDRVEASGGASVAHCLGCLRGNTRGKRAENARQTGLARADRIAVSEDIQVSQTADSGAVYDRDGVCPQICNVGPQSRRGGLADRRCSSSVLRIRGATGIGPRLGDAQSDLREAFAPLSAGYDRVLGAEWGISNSVKRIAA
jgi:hypothetical protein